MRNNNIDCLKAICAAEVVFTHFEFFGWSGVDSHFAVPCFLMISGYFLYTTDREKFNARVRKALRVILWLWLWTSAVYAAYHYLIEWKGDVPFVSLMDLRDAVLFNKNPFSGHLWYLQAYIYVLLILWALNRAGRLRLVWWWVAPSLVVCLLFGKYDVPLLGREFDFIYARNFLFLGLPFAGIGMWMRSRADAIQGNKWLHRWSPWLAALGVMMWLAEHCWLKLNDINSSGDLYVGGILISIFGMLTALTHSSGRESWLSRLGRDYSLPVYVFHMMVGRVLKAVPKNLHCSQAVLDAVNYWAAPLVLVATVACVWLWRRGQAKVRKV